MLKIFKNLKQTDILYLLIAAALIVVQVWLDLTMPDYTARLTAAVSAGALDMHVILKNGGMMLLCALGSISAAVLSGLFGARLAANFCKTLRSRLFDKITSFSAAEINGFSTPSLITRTTNDVVRMQMLLSMGLHVIFQAPILAVWAICKISSTGVEWTAATMITVLIMILTVSIAVGICYPQFKRIQRLTDDLNTATRENLSGVRVIRAFNAEEYQQQKFERVNRKITSANLFTSRILGLMMPVISTCMSGLTLAIYWIGAILINKTELTARAVVIGNMTAFTQYAMQVVMAFMMLIMVFVILPRALVSARRINEVLDTDPSIRFPDADAVPASRGELDFRDVSFAYSDDSVPCIHNISFKVQRGETFAIIGATGAGKTTLVNLIPRFYDATSGQVLIDGRDIRDYPRKTIERIVSIAPQRAILFKGDIASNVSYGSKEPVNDDDPRLTQALQIAHADFAFETEGGLHAEVAQGGTNFSGGQKQRLSIARALFKGAEIVIFDDSFSALDYRTDLLIRRDIRSRLSDTTVILVTQRIGTIQNADQILVLDNGLAVGLGRHEELMQTCPVYREIALSQLSKEEL